MFMILFMHTLYGCTFTISKVLVDCAPPIFVIGIRMLIAGSLLTLWTKSRKVVHEPTFDKTALFYLAQLAVFGIYFPYVLRYCAIQKLPVIKTALLYNIAPFGSFFFSYLFFKEKITLKKWLGLFIGCSSIFPFICAHIRESGSSSLLQSAWPELIMLVAVLSFSYSWVIMKRLVLHIHCSPARINGITMFFGGLLALMTSPIFENNTTIAHPIKFFFWLGMIILITNFICYNLYAKLLRTYSPTLLSLAGLLAPVSAATTSWFFLGEKVTTDCYISGVLVLVGFLIFYLEEIKNSPEPESLSTLSPDENQIEL